MKISVLVSVADMLVLIYRYQYRQNYNVIYMYGWTDIGPTLAGMRMGLRNSCHWGKNPKRNCRGTRGIVTDQKINVIRKGVILIRKYILYIWLF